VAVTDLEEILARVPKKVKPEKISPTSPLAPAPALERGRRK
jgi:hypothetical protein